MKVGEPIDLYWTYGRHDVGTIEQFIPLAIYVRIAGPPPITIIVPAESVREAGPNRWRVDL